MRWATVITDASFCPRTNTGGWAGWIKVDGLPTIKKSGPLKEVNCSASAELFAVLNGIWLALRAGSEGILVQTDCQAVITAYLNRRGKLGKIWQEALIRPDLRPAKLTFRHVKGHGPIHNKATYVNDWCDVEAKKAMKQARSKK